MRNLTNEIRKTIGRVEEHGPVTKDEAEEQTYF
jgi:hypothetical protein